VNAPLLGLGAAFLLAAFVLLMGLLESGRPR
jgi:hypothetical protein